MIFQVSKGDPVRKNLGGGKSSITGYVVKLDVLPQDGITSGTLTLNVSPETAVDLPLGACIDGGTGKIVTDPRVQNGAK